MLSVYFIKFAIPSQDLKCKNVSREVSCIFLFSMHLYGILTLCIKAPVSILRAGKIKVSSIQITELLPEDVALKLAFSWLKHME